MTLIELLDQLIAGESITPAEAEAVKEGLDQGTLGGRKQASDRLRAAADKLK